MFRNTMSYKYDVHMILLYQFLDFCGLSLLCGLQDAVHAVRCAALVLPLRPKDDPTDKFDDAVEFVRQLVTFLEVASSARAPWAQGEFSQLAALFAAQRDLKKVCLSCTKCEWNLATKARKKTDFAQEINNASYLVAIRHATGRNTRPLARSSSEAAFSTNTNCLSIQSHKSCL